MIKALRLVIALLALSAYLGQGAVMAGGGARVVDGQLYLLSDLCGGPDQAGHECPLCALAHATDLPPPLMMPRPGQGALKRSVWSCEVAVFAAGRYLRPPGRAPPGISA